MKKIFQKGSNLCIRLTLASLVLFVFSDCAYNPVSGKKELSFMSDQQERALGKQSDPSIIATYGLYENEELQAFINEKGKEMAAISHRTDLDYQFRILDSPIINAFAVPGGYVYFTRGILAHFNNEAEFAGVLGHEIGHITARHSAKQYTRQILGQGILVAGILLSPEVRQYANQASQAMQLVFLKFGRDQESQSDKLGVQYSSQIGYDAHHMANFFNTLHQMRAESGATMPNFLSTHPDPLDRYKKVGQMATKYQNEKPGQYATNRDKYLRMIDGLVYGEDPRQGYVENNVFYHPELKFQFPVPNTWKTINSPQQVQLVSQEGDAAVILMIAQEKSLDEAATKFVENNKLTMVNSEKTRINGLEAIVFISDQYPETNQQQAYQQQTYEQQSMAGGKGESKTGSTSQNTPTKTTTTTKPPISNKSGSSNSGSSSNNTRPPKSDTPLPKQGQNPPTGNNSNPQGQNPPPTQGGVAPTMRIQSAIIEYNGFLYGFHGLAKYPDFQRNQSMLQIPMKGFKQLKDASKINVKPSKISIKAVGRDGSLASALKAHGARADQMDELALINGMKLDDQVTKGSLIKLIVK